MGVMTMPPPAPVPSPCVRCCTLDHDDVCLGCGRTLQDITGWTAMSEAQKAQCVARAAEALRRKGRPVQGPLPGRGQDG